jgi:hypothetical protein
VHHGAPFLFSGQAGHRGVRNSEFTERVDGRPTRRMQLRCAAYLSGFPDKMQAMLPIIHTSRIHLRGWAPYWRAYFGRNDTISGNREPTKNRVQEVN